MLENCRWLLYVSRFLGCHPHTIDERSRVFGAKFRLLLIFSFVSCGLYISFIYILAKMIAYDYCGLHKLSRISCALQVSNRYTLFIFKIVIILLSCWQHSEFEQAVTIACKFDDLMKRHNWSTNNIRINCCIQWLIILAILFVWLGMGILVKIELPAVEVRMIAILLISSITFSVDILKFYFIFQALYYRFYRLNGLSRKLIGMANDTDSDESLTNVNHLTISDLHQLHSCLTDATKYFNSYYSPQLLCWILFMLFNMVTRIFNIVYILEEIGLICVGCVETLLGFIQFIFISNICHLTCDEANALARTIFSTITRSVKHIELSTEMIEFGVRLQIHPLRIRVCGLFSLDKQFALTAFSVMLTYLVLASSLYSA